MNNRVLTFIFAALLSVVGAKADGIPSGYFSEVASGEFYLYNVTQLLEDDLAGASRDNPIDVTDKFIANPRYEDNDNEGWKGNVQPGIDATNNLQNAEFFNTNFDTWQDLQGLPEGTYRLSLPDGTSYSRSIIAEPMSYDGEGRIRRIPATVEGVSHMPW